MWNSMWPVFKEVKHDSQINKCQRNSKIRGESITWCRHIHWMGRETILNERYINVYVNDKIFTYITMYWRTGDDGTFQNL